MTAQELKGLRERLQLSAVEFGRLLGYTGKPQNIQHIIWLFESGRRNIPPRVVLRCQELQPKRRKPR